jgi:hypothetical protein
VVADQALGRLRSEGVEMTVMLAGRSYVGASGSPSCQTSHLARCLIADTMDASYP